MKGSAPTPSSGRRRRIEAALLLFALVVISFSPVLRNGFVNWDDDAYVTENPMVRGATLASIPDFLTSLSRIQYKPVVFLFFAAEYRFFRLHPGAYHTVSLALHALNTVLVFVLFFLLREDLFIAFGVAALFGIHPLRVESVAWVTEQKDLLYGLFFLMASIAYILHRQRARRPLYYLSLVFFCLSLLAKPMAVMFPLVLAGMDVFSPRQKGRGPFLDKMPFFAVSAAVILINALALRWLDMRHAVSFSPAVVVCRLGFYISKIFFPHPLSCFYPEGAECAPGFLVAAFAIPGILAFLCYKRRLLKTFLFGIFFFLAVLAPVLLIEGKFGVADRYVYVASLGFFLIVLEWGASFGSGRAALVALGLAAGLFSCLSFQRCSVWRDGAALWEDALATYPRSTVAHLNAGSAYFSLGDDEQARRHARALLALDPRSSDGLLLLANVDFRQKRYADARRLYAYAVRLNPASCAAYNGLGLTSYAQGRFPEAAVWFRKAVQLDSASFQSAVNLADAYLGMNEKAGAIAWLRKAASLKPDDATTWRNLAVLLFEEGRYGECLLVYKRLLALEPGDANVYRNAGIVLDRLGLTDEARSMFESAGKITPRLSTGPAGRCV